MIWSQKHTACFESHWMSMQRLMYLNHLSGSDMYRTLTRMAQLSGKQKQQRDRNTPTWLDHVIAAGKPLERFHQQLGLLEKSLSMRLSRGWLGYSTNLRYCRLCLDQCFHSVLFQFPFVLQCPYHRCALQDTCWHCKRPLGSGAIDNPYSTKKALHCNHCEALLLIPERPMRQVVSGYVEAESVFRDAHLRLERLLQAAIATPSRSSIMEQRSPWVWDFCYHSLAKFTDSERRATDWMKTLDPHEIDLFQIPAQEDVRAHSDSENQDLLAIAHRLDELTEILRSIQRQLHERVRMICGHRHVADLDCGVCDVNSGQSPDHLCMLSGDCPSCACLRWWRAQVSVYFGLREFLRGCVDLHCRVRNLEVLTVLIPLEPRRVAGLSLALFAYQARAMLRLMEHQTEPSAGEAQGSDGEDRTKFTWASGAHPQLWHLNLWLGCLPDASLTLFDARRSVQARYSLRGAWRALEQSVSLQRRSSVRQDRKLQWLVTKHPHPGHWYAAMALNHNRRLWREWVA